MTLPFPDRLRVDKTKVTGYLLSQANSQGKANFFLGFGFRPEGWSIFSNALKAQARANPVSAVVASLTAPVTVLTANWKHRAADVQEFVPSGYLKTAQTNCD